jgi:hypothetical protein
VSSSELLALMIRSSIRRRRWRYTIEMSHVSVSFDLRGEIGSYLAVALGTASNDVLADGAGVGVLGGGCGILVSCGVRERMSGQTYPGC